jgi:hypothetical protein
MGVSSPVGEVCHFVLLEKVLSVPSPLLVGICETADTVPRPDRLQGSRAPVPAYSGRFSVRPVGPLDKLKLCIGQLLGVFRMLGGGNRGLREIGVICLESSFAKELEVGGDFATYA